VTDLNRSQQTKMSHRALVALLLCASLLLAACGAHDETEAPAEADLGNLPKQLGILAEAVDRAEEFLALHQEPDGSWLQYAGSYPGLADARPIDPLNGSLLVLLALQPRTCEDTPMLCTARDYAVGRLLSEEPCASGAENLALAAWVAESAESSEQPISAAFASIRDELAGDDGLLRSRSGGCASAAPAGSVDLAANLSQIGLLWDRDEDTGGLVESLASLRAASSWAEIDSSLPLPAIAYLVSKVAPPGSPVASVLVPDLVTELGEWLSSRELEEFSTVELAGYLALQVEHCRLEGRKCPFLGPVVGQLMRGGTGDGGWAARPFREMGTTGAWIGSPALSTAVSLDALDRFRRWIGTSLALDDDDYTPSAGSENAHEQ
jgi:hypothetical protein